MNDIRRFCNLAFATIALMGLVTIGVSAVKAAEHGSEAVSLGQVQSQDGVSESGGDRALSDRSAAFLAIALTMGIACLSAAYAVGKVGAAALGAAAEKPELLNKALPFVGLGEGIAVLGMLISFLIWMKL